MNIVCVPVKSYKLEEFGEITLLYNSVMYYNITNAFVFLIFLDNRGWYLPWINLEFPASLWTKILIQGYVGGFPPERKQIQFYPLKVTSPVIHGFIDVILNTWPILLTINFYVEQT